jgi:urease beta subunit
LRRVVCSLHFAAERAIGTGVHSHLYNVNAAFEQNERFITILKDTEAPAVT